MSRILGIDLGTSNSAAAIMVSGKPIIIPSAEGLTKHGKMFPSLVTFKENGGIIVGKQEINAETTITAIKRKMGTDYLININGRKYAPQEISSHILKKIKNDAEKYIGEKIEKAVITVPAYFNDNQRTATKNAGILAGLNVLRIISEPTAASLAYGLDKAQKALKIAVLDLGGGTFDVTILEMHKGIFKVIATSGDTQLGGRDMDDKIIDYFVEELKKKYNVNLNDDIDLNNKNNNKKQIKNNKKQMQNIRQAAEKAKIKLSSLSSTNIKLNIDRSEPELTLTREKLENLIKDVINKLDIPLKQALVDSRLKLEDIDKIILVGGPTRMPIIREKFRKFFGKEPEQGIDPMECVAIGAVIQGSILSGDIKDMVLLDVTPLSLGIETSGGVFTQIIKRNTTIPTEETKVFTTSKDNQQSVAVHVLQGERAMAVDNITLGVFNLTKIRPAPRYEPNIEVCFDLDADGILHVSAKDIETGKEQKIEVTGSVISKKVREQVIKEAEEFAKEDRKKKEKIEVYNNAKALIYGAKRIISDIDSGDKSSENKYVHSACKASEHQAHGNTIRPFHTTLQNMESANELCTYENDRETIEQKIAELKQALGLEDINKIKTCANNLDVFITKLLERKQACKNAHTVINIVTKRMKELDDQTYIKEKKQVNQILSELKGELKQGNTEEIKENTSKLLEFVDLVADIKL